MRRSSYLTGTVELVSDSTEVVLSGFRGEIRIARSRKRGSAIILDGSFPKPSSLLLWIKLQFAARSLLGELARYVVWTGVSSASAPSARAKKRY